jgi:hypothetical protein
LSKSSKFIDSRKQIPVARPNPRWLNPTISEPMILLMTPNARLTNPAKIIAIARFLMFFMPCHLLLLLIDLPRTTNSTKTIAPKEIHYLSLEASYGHLPETPYHCGLQKVKGKVDGFTEL